MEQELTINSIRRELDPNTVEYIQTGYGQAFHVSDDRIYIQGDQNPHQNDHGLRPAAFKFDATNIPLIVSVACNIGTGQGTFFIQAVGPGGFTIRSSNFQAVGKDSTENFTNIGPFQTTAHLESPFREAGNWLWSLHDVNAPDQPVAKMTLQLELYFLLGSTLPNLYGAHYLDLIRVAFPPYSLIAGRQWAAVEEDVIFHVALNLVNLGGNMQRHYDVRKYNGGFSEHVDWVNFWFKLDSFMTMAPNTCNCSDLAYLTTVAFASLGQRPSAANANVLEPVVNANISWGQPWGYINEGPLFGYFNDVSQNCNNPFWLQDPPANHATPWNRAMFDNDRTAFSGHCFTKILNSANNERVVDVCHGSIDHQGHVSIYGGLMDVNAFVSNAIDFRNGATHMPQWSSLHVMGVHA